MNPLQAPAATQRLTDPQLLHTDVPRVLVHQLTEQTLHVLFTTLPNRQHPLNQGRGGYRPRLRL